MVFGVLVCPEQRVLLRRRSSVIVNCARVNLVSCSVLRASCVERLLANQTFLLVLIRHVAFEADCAIGGGVLHADLSTYM